MSTDPIKNDQKDQDNDEVTGNGMFSHATNAFNSATKGLSNLFGNGEGADEQKPASSPETMLPKINNASGPSGGRRRRRTMRRGRKGKKAKRTMHRRKGKKSAKRGKKSAKHGKKHMRRGGGYKDHMSFHDISAKRSHGKKSSKHGKKHMRRSHGKTHRRR